MRFEYLKKREFVFIGLYLLFFLLYFLYFYLQLGNKYIYADTFLYVIWARKNAYFDLNIVYNSLPLSIDYQTLIKPLVFLYTSFFDGFPILILNGVLFFGFLTYLYLDQKGKNSTFFIYLAIASVFLNANLLFWSGRLSAEPLVIFLLSGYIFWAHRMKYIALLSLLLICLLRPEFILLVPILLLLVKPTKFDYLFILATHIWPFIVALHVGNLYEYLHSVFIPTIAVLIFLYCLHSIDEKKKSLLVKGLILVILLSILLYSSQYIYKLYFDPTFEISFSAALTSIVLMFPLVFLFVISLIRLFQNDSTNRQIIFMTAIFCLYGIYSQKVDDNFRYFLYLTPFIAFLVRDVFSTLCLPSLVKASYILLTVIFAFLVPLVLPMGILKSNYWVMRFKDISPGAKIYSTTPVISAYLGYQSSDVCVGDFSMQKGVFILVDDVGKSLCPEIMKKIEEIPNKTLKYTYETKETVELGRYSSNSQKTMVYVIDDK